MGKICAIVKTFSNTITGKIFYYLNHDLIKLYTQYEQPDIYKILLKYYLFLWKGKAV